MRGSNVWRAVVGCAITAAMLVAGVISAGALASGSPEAPREDITIIAPCPIYQTDTRCCNDHECLSSYPRYVRVSPDGAEDVVSENPGGIEPPYTAVDNGIPDPIDAANDDGGDGLAARPALEQEGIDMSHVTILDDDSAVIDAAAAAGFSDCPYKWTCLWQHAHFRGRAYFARASSDGHAWRNLRDFGLSDQVSSWRNRRGYVTWLARDIDGGGPTLCLARFSNNPRMYYMNDKASSFRLSTAKFCGA